MSLPDSPPAKSEGSRSSSVPLPPISPPTGTFILQLFLIPLLIVTIVIMLWLMFSWVAHMGRDNAADLAKAIERGDTASWQRAYELAELLRSPDKRYDALRSDSALAAGLAKFLQRDLKEPLVAAEIPPGDDNVAARGKGTYSGRQAPPGSERRARVMRRMYLCRALGEFYIPDGLPTLLKAAQQESDPVEVQVRFAAIEAIATLADHCGPEKLQGDAEVMSVVLAASRAADEGDAPPIATKDDDSFALYRPHSELRAVAAYALGVIGGDEANERLAQMLHDTYPNARYNAATGLARSGDVRCQTVLREMLDPENQLAVKDEANPNDQARKRTTVLLNGMKATLHLAQANKTADLSPLKSALETIASSPLETVLVERSKVKAAAAEALRLIDSRN